MVICNQCGKDKDGIVTGLCNHCGKFGQTNNVFWNIKYRL